jgi:hypothetical protein
VLWPGYNETSHASQILATRDRHVHGSKRPHITYAMGIRLRHQDMTLLPKARRTLVRRVDEFYACAHSL